MIDDMRGGCIAAGAAEPFVARKAFYDTAGVVDSAIPDETHLSVSKI